MQRRMEIVVEERRLPMRTSNEIGKEQLYTGNNSQDHDNVNINLSIWGYCPIRVLNNSTVFVGAGNK
jgi:hypothetical protein